VEHPPVFRLIAGLGNPGREYEGTRHNIGFQVLDELARRFATGFRFESKWDSDVAVSGGRTFMKPKTFMNLSGEAVSEFVRYYRIEPSEVLVVCDDAAIPLGDLRMRKNGSSGGQNGLESVLIHLSTEAVPRLRVGIGAAIEGVPMDRHVLGKFLPEERSLVEEVIGRAADAIEYANAHGIDSAMNVYNKKKSL
jgi:PTH1 family peptidyl-tRNA hydrolase